MGFPDIHSGSHVSNARYTSMWRYQAGASSTLSDCSGDLTRISVSDYGASKGVRKTLDPHYAVSALLAHAPSIALS